METYEKIENAETKELKYEAHVTIIIEPTEHFTTKPEKVKKWIRKVTKSAVDRSLPFSSWIFFLDLFKYVDF